MRAVAVSPGYAELAVTTNFSFLRGASHADELVNRAAELRHRAIAVTDRDTLAGAVRMHVAAKRAGLKLLIGSRLTFTDAPDVLAWVTDRAAYARLCRLLTLGRRRAGKGECQLSLGDLLEYQEGLLLAVVPPEGAGEMWIDSLRLLRHIAGKRLSLAIRCLHGPRDRRRLAHLAAVGADAGVPLLATNDVHYHDPGRRALQDVLTCIRHGCTIHEAGMRLLANAERHLKSPEQMHRLLADYPCAIGRTLHIAEQCVFSLDELRYEYPDELMEKNSTPLATLNELTWRGAAGRYPQGIPDSIRRQIEHELQLIAQLRYEPYFLTVYDLVMFARSRGILCQGRGSAANSAVCYCLGVTGIDPGRIDLLFERFISAARNEPPDIDIDFEHERREEVIQYLYEKYGRERAGMTATVITYRPRSAVRDVGKALGLSLDLVDAMAKKLDWWDRGVIQDERLRQIGLDPTDRTIRLVVELTGQLLGFPRHLSQHVGGMVMTREPLCEMVPIENASMQDRTVIQWDKDDIDALGILKVDVLGLGMLTCIGKALKMINSGKETERRRDGETKWGNGRTDGTGEHVSGFGGLAEGNGAGAACVYRDSQDAQDGTIRHDYANAQGCGFGSVEHCRGIRTPIPIGTSEVSTDRQGLTERSIDPTATGLRPGNAGLRRPDRSDDPGNGPRAAGIDSEPGREGSLSRDGETERRRDEVEDALSRDGETERRRDEVEDGPFLSSTPSLRLSVSPSLSPLQLHTIPAEDPAVYEMISNADTIGVFQIESRAQMSMLPRLRPTNFYDLVIEVAIVRPGPIQGDMVHPYLRRRCGEEKVEYPSEALRRVLHKTLGVPLFQEQAMKIAMVAAGFSAEEADQLRRAMAAWRYNGHIEKFHRKIVDGMLANGYARDFAQRCFDQIKGFGEYGFPESHAASFALLVYASAWIKRHHPAVFACALLNSQPMGFYAPAQIVRDAREHHVEVRSMDVNHSFWDCTLEGSGDSPALRLGFRQIRGLGSADGERIAATRQSHGPFHSVADFQQTTQLSRQCIRRLAHADAFGSLGLSRRPALWQTLELSDTPAPLFDFIPDEPPPPTDLPQMPIRQEVLSDYATAGLSLKRHPVSLLRGELTARRIIPAKQLEQIPHGRWISVAGLVLVRQRPGTASGIVFVTLEDETGIANLIIRAAIYDRYRAAARHATLLQADGYVQKQGQVIHILAMRMYDLSDWLAGHKQHSRDFH